MLRLIALSAILLFPAISSAVPILVNYEATIATVSGNPFGLSAANIGAAVTGFFQYETGTTDVNPGNTQRGEYEHVGTAPFQALLPGSTIGGSGNGFVEVENFGTTDTFRFRDGDSVFYNAGTMTVNGSSDTNVQVVYAFSGDLFSSDALPNPWLLDASATAHTMSISQGSGNTVLLQITRTQEQLTSTPEPSTMLLFAAGLCVFGLRARRR